MASTSEKTEQRQLQQVCDNCRFRKTKCNRDRPCSNCVMSGIKCQYLHTLRRKGPRGGNGRRISQIRRGLVHIGDDKTRFEQHVPDTDSSPTNLSPSRQGQKSNIVRLRGESGPTDDMHASPPTTSTPYAIQDVRHHAPSFLNSTTPFDKQQLSTTIAAHARMFLKHLFPIMPVVDHDTLMADVWRLDELSPQRYAFLLSLCAATRLQLRLDYVEECHASVSALDMPLDCPVTGEWLLEAAEQSRRQYSVVDDTSLDGILTPYFMGVGYGNLEKHRHASFYLNQSVSMALSMGLDRESTYIHLPGNDREVARRIFWLLFVTERTYSLQHRRPVMLRCTIAKPEIVDCDYPIVMHDFVNHIRLFEKLPYSLYDWNSSTADDYQTGGVTLCRSIIDKLCTVRPSESILESQRFDSLVTQQWLRVSMWRLAFGCKPNPAYVNARMPTFTLPFEAGKSIMGAMASVVQSSKDCHGIAIEQKLFDIGVSLADTVMPSTSGARSFELGPLDLLPAIVKCMSLIRGCPSHLLPPLLEHSQNALACVNPLNSADLGWLLESQVSLASGGDAPPSVIEHIDEDSSSVETWQSEGNFGCLEGYPESYMPLVWEESILEAEQLVTSFDQKGSAECAAVEVTTPPHGDEL